MDVREYRFSTVGSFWFIVVLLISTYGGLSVMAAWQVMHPRGQDGLEGIVMLALGVIASMGMIVYLAWAIAGRGVIDEQGVRLWPLLRTERRLTWSDVQSVRWTGGTMAVVSGRVKLEVMWTWFDSDVREQAKALARERLEEQFDLSLPPPPKHSLKRIVALGAPVTAAMLVPYFFIMRDPTGAWAKPALVMMFVPCVALYGMMFVMGWRRRREADSPLRWRGRKGAISP